MNAAVRLPDHLDAEGGAGLQRDPFQSRFDDAFYFDEAVRAKRLNLLFHLVPYSDVLLLTGEPGSGKSCILHRLLAGANDSWRICHFQATAEIDSAKLLELLHKEFSLRPDGQGDGDQRLRLLRESLYALRHSALVPVLVVDDAHLLTHSALSMLAVLTEPWQNKDKLLSVVLFGEPEINKKLIAPGLEELRARVSHTFDIPPLSEEETGKYIRHRLNVAGLKAGGPFTDSVIKFIHVASRGYPGRINEFARVVLQNSEQKDARAEAPISPGSRGRVYFKYGVAAILVSLAVVTLLYQDRLTYLMAQWKKGETIPASSTTQPAPPAPSPAEDTARGSPDSRTPSAEVPVTAAENADSMPDSSAAADLVQQQPAALPSAAGVPEANTPIPPAGAPVASGPAGTDAPTSASTDVIAAAEDQSTVAAGGDTETDTAPVAEGEISAAVAPAELPHDGDWLLAQDPAYYTLQLLIAKRAQCLDYIQRYALGDVAAIFQTRSAGKVYFTLVYGIYPTEVDAVDAGKALSEQDVKVSPWVRKVGVVQAKVREFHTTAGVPPPANTTNKGVTAPGEIRRESWLLEQPPDAYTLQLFAGKEANVFAYLKRHALMDKAALFRPAADAERLAVTYGVYPGKAEAMQAAKELAAQLPDLKPWTRPLREIQAIIAQQAAATPSPP